MNDPLISVLIITWNRKSDIIETIQSVYDQAYRKFEIIVVDNGSTDGTVDALRYSYPEVRLVALTHNIGASAGRNAGIAIAQGEFIVSLDSDASPAVDMLASLVCKFKCEPGIGVINCKVVNAYTKTLDGSLGWVYSEKQKACQDAEFLSFTFTEGAAAIRKEVFDRAGMFWDFLSFGCEGEELSLRVWDVGYKILYYPKALVYHRVSPNMRIASSERDCMIARNALCVYFVRYPWWMLIIVMPLKVIVLLVRGAKRRYLRQAISALINFIQQLPFLYKYRHPISNSTARFYLNLLRQQGPLSWDLISWLKYKA